MTLLPFSETITRELKKPAFAAAYLQDALEESVAEFLIGLRKYIRANGGIAPFAAKAQMSEETVQLLLSTRESLDFDSLNRLLQGAGLSLKIEASPTRISKERELVGDVMRDV